MIFDIPSEARRITEDMLHDPEYWRSLGKPVPTQFLGFAIPQSIRKDVERDTDPPEPSLAMRLLGRKLEKDGGPRKHDERELRTIYNRRED